MKIITVGLIKFRNRPIKKKRENERKPQKRLAKNSAKLTKSVGTMRERKENGCERKRRMQSAKPKLMQNRKKRGVKKN